MNKKITFVALVLIAGIAGLFIWWGNASSYQNISINFDPNVKSADLFESEGEGHDVANKPIKSILSSQELKLKKGTYVMVTNPSSDFASENIYFELGDEKVTLNTKSEYKPEKLQSLLSKEQAAITEAFNKKYEPVAGYSLQKGQLFGDGTWFGALLVPSSPDQDNLRLVMQKKNNQWVVATDPPEIVLSAVVYPEIPREILQAVNFL